MSKKININLPKIEYYTLEEAAKELGCSENDLLHLGETGKLKLSVKLIHNMENLSNEKIRIYDEENKFEFFLGEKILKEMPKHFPSMVFSISSNKGELFVIGRSQKEEKLTIKPFKSVIFIDLEPVNIAEVIRFGQFHAKRFKFNESRKYVLKGPLVLSENEELLKLSKKEKVISLGGGFNTLYYEEYRKKDLFIMSDELDEIGQQKSTKKTVSKSAKAKMKWEQEATNIRASYLAKLKDKGVSLPAAKATNELISHILKELKNRGIKNAVGADVKYKSIKTFLEKEQYKNYESDIS